MQAVSYEVVLVALKLLAKRPGSASFRVTAFIKSTQDIICVTTDGVELSLSYLLAARFLELYPGDNSDAIRQGRFVLALSELQHNRGDIADVLAAVVQFRKF